jgi:MgtC family
LIAQIRATIIFPMSGLDPLLVALATALGIGLLIGTERERRKGEKPKRAAFGLRTFALASLAGALSFIIGSVLLLAIATSAILALAAIAYWREPGGDLTTEIALLSTVLLGGLAVRQPGLSAAIAVAVAILLNAKTALRMRFGSLLFL